MFIWTHCLTLVLNFWGLISDLSSGGRELNRAALLQKNPPLEMDKCDWILIVFSCLLCNDWLSALVRSWSFFDRYWGCFVTKTFWAVVRVESAVSCWMVKSPVTLASWAVGVPSGRLVLSRLRNFDRESIRELPWGRNSRQNMPLSWILLFSMIL